MVITQSTMFWDVLTDAFFPCYAFNMAKRFGNVKTYSEWIEPKLVGNALELLEKEIPRYKKDIKSVQLSFTTDPFMVGYDDITDMTLKIINRLNKDSIKVTTLTKGIIPKDALNTAKYNEFGITLVSLSNEFKNIYEKYCSDYEKRIGSLRMMHDGGFKTWVSIEPYPTPNICKQELLEILEKVNFVDYVVLEDGIIIKKYLNINNTNLFIMIVPNWLRIVQKESYKVPY